MEEDEKDENMFFLDMACLGTNEVSWIFSFARVNRNTLRR